MEDNINSSKLDEAIKKKLFHKRCQDTLNRKCQNNLKKALKNSLALFYERNLIYQCFRDYEML